MSTTISTRARKQQMSTQQGHEKKEIPEIKIETGETFLLFTNGELLFWVIWMQSEIFKSAIHDHLTSNIKIHFDLIIKSFDALQQTIQQYHLRFKLWFNKLTLFQITMLIDCSYL
ncbi:hypothetical protein RFI_33945 [Reticulomyxa filosa]|uniref:Uncharacterized protein n=1 Tax=Reticulomyxa filosa TaxID=46433 RepID=X6LQQ2_RETFI|nr:hypothetical protein RFI_33945 [Reticulomyxa filosa]|eukprot:ETO03462.1 hypothetical protein RFI_33945 [Reticulomyxa filosa]